MEQCRKKLRRLVPDAVLVPVSSTTEGVKMVLKNNGNEAAICSSEAVNEYKLKLLTNDIQDYKENYMKHWAIFGRRELICLKYWKGLIININQNSIF